jgi:hypothetical protein
MTSLRHLCIVVLRGHRLAEQHGVTKNGLRISAIHCDNGTDIHAEVFLDATYEGDLLAGAGIGTAVGREGNAKYGETKNGIRTDTTHGQFDRPVDPYTIPGDRGSGLIVGVQDAGNTSRASIGSWRTIRLSRKQSDPSGRLGVCVGTSSPTTEAGLAASTCGTAVAW